MDCNQKRASSLLTNLKDMIYGHVSQFVMLSNIFWTICIFIRLGSRFYRQTVGIPRGTSCAPFVTYLFLLCYERNFMLSLSDNIEAEVV